MLFDNLSGFDWDTGNWPKCGKHGVSKTEIESVFYKRPLVLKDRFPDEIEQRFNAVGQNDKGRAIFVVFVMRQFAGSRLIRPLSARYMHKKEVERYEKER